MPRWQDLRYSLRLLRREPRFSAVAILTLALAIGASTSLFGVIDAALRRAVPYPHPEQLAEVFVADSAGSLLGPSLNDGRAWRTALPAQVQQVCAWRTWTPEVVDARGFDRVLIRRWSEGCLDLYGIQPVIGRGFVLGDLKAGAAPVAMLGYAYWQMRYGGSRDVLGQTIRVENTPATVVGIVPASQDRTTAVFVPLRDRRACDADRRGTGTETILRLRAGVTVPQAAAAIDGVLRAGGGVHAQVTSLYAETTRGAATTIRTLGAAVALILLLACVNVGGLLLARGRARQRELAIRASIGASRSRLILQLIAESLLLAVLAATLGVVLSWATLDLVVALVPMSLPADAPVRVNLTVLAWTIAVACASALIFGLVPALRLTRRAAEHALARTARRDSSPLSRRTGQLLVASEVALAMVLLAGAGVMVRSLARLLTADVGIDTAHVVSMHVVPGDERPPVLTSYYPALWEAVRRVPGVEQAGAIDYLPLIGGGAMGAVKIGDTFEMVESAQVLPGYFEACGIRLVAGRLPVEADLHGPPTVVISEDAAQKFFGREPAVGRQLVDDGTTRQVIGVVANVKHWGAEWTALARPKVYGLFGQDKYPRPLTIVLRLQRGVPLPANELRKAAAAIGPRVFVEDFKRGSEWVGENTIADRHRTMLFVLLGGFGLLLAVAGVFSMTAYAVASRTREIGVRMALGARAGQVVGQVLREAVWPIALGTVAGVLAAAAATRVIASFLFNTAPTDAPTFAITAAALIGAGGLAAWWPARHAARVDPASALRSE